MDSLLILLSNLLSPPVIVFITGVACAVAHSDLKFPPQAYQLLTIYLLLAIGLKGGIALAATPLGTLVLPLLITLAAGACIPLGVYVVTRKVMGLSVDDSAAMAAHYGSVSAVTFMACIAFLDSQGVAYEGFMTALMALMEVPAILMGVFLAKFFGHRADGGLKATLHEVFSGKSFALLMCGLVAGALASDDAVALVKESMLKPFYGVLTLFLLEMGLIAGSKLGDVRSIGWPLVAFAVASPIVQALLGLSLAWSIGMSQGGAVIFSVLCASASYIAAPAAVRASIPNANPAYYVSSSLGMTFPFNLTFGIPLYYGLSHLLYT
jgi:hypothetical protein